VLGAHQAAVGDEVPHVGEALDVVQLVEQHQRQDLADAGNRLQPLIGLRIVDPSATNQVEFQGSNLFVEMLGQGEVALDATARARVGERRGDAFSIRRAAELLAEKRPA